MLNKEEAEKILDIFMVYDHINSIQCIQESEKECNYRGVFQINTDSRTLICRISNEDHYPAELVERQSEFAMLLYREGIPTAKKYQCKDGFCANIKIKNRTMRVTLEEYIGEDLTSVSTNTFYEFGQLIGKTHAISQNKGALIGKSFIAYAIKNSKACFRNILTKAYPAMPETGVLSKIGDKHDALVQGLLRCWNLLPTGAVHGDLGIYNNLMTTRKGLGIIDFNLSGDEVYIGDALSSFYASIHKYSWQEKIRGINLNNAFYLFWKGYMQERPLNAVEEQWFPTIAALFDGLFYSKRVIEIWNAGDQKKALESLIEAESYFDPEIHSIPMTS